MATKLSASELLAKTDLELQLHFDKAEQRWETLRSLSNVSRSNFNEKLAVLSAGSLAVLATAATSLHNKPLSSPVAGQSVLLEIGLSAILLWISLCLSVFHNLCDSFGLAREAKIYITETLLLTHAKRIIHGFNGANDYTKVHAEWEKSFRFVERLRKIQSWISFAAFAVFAAGYADIVLMMIRILSLSQ